MSTKIRELLQQQDFFQAIAPTFRNLFEDCSRLVEFAEDEYVCREGDQANDFYLVVQGRLGLEIYVPSQGALTTQIMGPGEFLGWSWLVEPYRWSMDVKALEPVQLIQVNGLCIRGKIEENHEFGFHLLRKIISVMSTRLSSTRLQLMDVYGKVR